MFSKIQSCRLLLAMGEERCERRHGQRTPRARHAEQRRLHRLRHRPCLRELRMGVDGVGGNILVLAKAQRLADYVAWTCVWNNMHRASH